MFFRRTVKAGLDASTKTTCRDPLLMASKPRLPVPEKRSSTLLSSHWQPRISKTDSLTRSAVGRIPLPRGENSLFPFAFPEIIRMAVCRSPVNGLLHKCHSKNRVTASQACLAREGERSCPCFVLPGFLPTGNGLSIHKDPVELQERGQVLFLLEGVFAPNDQRSNDLAFSPPTSRSARSSFSCCWGAFPPNRLSGIQDNDGISVGSETRTQEPCLQHPVWA